MAVSWVEQGRPIPVHWAGWESDTYRLGRMGWKVSQQSDPRRMADCFVFHHPGFGISAVGTLNEPYRHMQSNIRYQAMIDPNISRIEIENVASVGHFHFRQMRGNFDLTLHRRIDTEPSAVEVSDHELHRMPLFAELFAGRPETQELVVEPQDVQQLLDQIVRLQAPGMREIRARDRKREEREPANKQVHAQIISLRAA